MTLQASLTVWDPGALPASWKNCLDSHLLNALELIAHVSRWVPAGMVANPSES